MDILKKETNIDGLQSTLLFQSKKYLKKCKDKFIQIMFVDNNHWLTVSNVMSKDVADIFIYDSISVNETEKARQIYENLKECTQYQKDINLYWPRVTQQMGYKDCGLFAIAFAASLAVGEDPIYINYNQRKMRNHLINCFNNNKITPFPRIIKCTMCLEDSESDNDLFICNCCKEQIDSWAFND